MKASFHALLALMALTLSACTTFNPMQPHVTVYPADNKSIVIDSSVPAADQEVTPAIVAEVPPVAPTIEMIDTPSIEIAQAEIDCMALAIYHEARGEPEKGQVAVGYVIINRVNHPGYPKTVCGVVRDSNRRGCQFSWYCDGKSDVPRDMNSYNRAKTLAVNVFKKNVPNPVGNAIYFDGYVHGSKRRPGQVRIGNQRFFASYK